MCPGLEPAALGEKQTVIGEGVETSLGEYSLFVPASGNSAMRHNGFGNLEGRLLNNPL
jgi:hypothetical protein